MQIKDNMLSALKVAQDIIKRCLHQQAEATINKFLANPMAGTSDESAKDAEIKELKKQVEMDRLLQAKMVSGWVAKEARKDREMSELKIQMQRLQEDLGNKEDQSHARAIPLSLDPAPAEHIYFEPLEQDMPSTSTHAGKEAEELDT